MATPRGIHLLYRALVDGRDQVPILQVDKTGTRQKGVNGKLLEATPAWLRTEAAPPAQPSGGTSSSSGTNGAPSLPDRVLLTRLGEFRKAVDHLEDAHAQLRDVKDASGKILVEQDGLAADTVDDIRGRLESLSTDLAIYGRTWKKQNTSPPSRTPDGEPDETSSGEEAE